MRIVLGEEEIAEALHDYIRKTPFLKDKFVGKQVGIAMKVDRSFLGKTVGTIEIYLPEEGEE